MTDTKENLNPDSVSDAYYVWLFRNAYLEKKGTDFQNWFVKLAGHAFKEDFRAVRPYGNQGDWKSDGQQVSTGTVFQCYAPDLHTEKKIISKIDTDFIGAKAEWPDFMKTWVFVYNDNRGNSPSINHHINKLCADHPDIKIEIWAEPNLLGLFEMMSLNAKRLMFGEVPNQSTVNNLALKDIAPVIDALEKQEFDHSNLFPPAPSPEKLQRNNLSKSSAGLLSLGRRKVKLVEKYFTKVGSAELGEKIAQSFRNRYYELKALELDADKIFTHLHEHVGVYAEPEKKVAAMAILAYFFDNCDIFENPTE